MNSRLQEVQKVWIISLKHAKTYIDKFLIGIDLDVR